MWPAMMAGPMTPGRGDPVYQPATAVEDGTCNAPSAARPSSTRRVCTPIRGMVSETGLATRTELASGISDGETGGRPGGGSTIGPRGTGTVATPAGGGRMAGVECLLSRPTVPTVVTSRPAAMVIATGLGLNGCFTYAV